MSCVAGVGAAGEVAGDAVAGLDGVADVGVPAGAADLVSFCGAADCDQAGIAISTLAQITNVKRRTLAALFGRRVISRPGIHT